MTHAFLLVAIAAAMLGGMGVAAAQPPPPLPVLLDRDMTVGAGASVTAAVGAAIARAEEKVPVRLFAERGVPRRAGNVAYRLLKLGAFELPQELWLLVANHEVFGHGGRLRELFDGPIGYRIAAPPPYGRGGGATSFELDREPNGAQLLAVSAAGMEANAVAAGLIARQAFASGKMRARDAMRYLAFELDAFTYIRGTGDEPEEAGHDVSDFLQTYNLITARGGSAALTARVLRRDSLVSLANPMLGYAVYSIARHVWDGTAAVSVATLSVRGVRFLPLVTYGLTAFGTEWTVSSDIAAASRNMRFEASVGRAPGSTPWRIAARHARAAEWRGWHIDVDVHAWRQPRLSGAAERVLTTGPLIGGMLRGRVERPLVPVWFSAHHATLLIDLGVKSAGFVPGEPMRRGALVRAGLGFPFGR